MVGAYNKEKNNSSSPFPLYGCDKRRFRLRSVGVEFTMSCLHYSWAKMVKCGVSEEYLRYLLYYIVRQMYVCIFQITNSQAPWKSILKSIPFWALCILNFGYAWMIISLCIYGPFYYSMVLNYNIYNVSTNFQFNDFYDVFNN
jgi:hypothetical protein